MMYAVIVLDVLGFAAQASMQSIVSNAADAHTQGQTMGAVSSLNSLMAVLAPVIGAPLLARSRTCRRATGDRPAVLLLRRAAGAGHAASRMRHFRRTRRTSRAACAEPCTHDKILILDFGSQVTQLIARRVREAHVYCEIHPNDVSDEWVREYASSRPRA